MLLYVNFLAAAALGSWSAHGRVLYYGLPLLLMLLAYISRDRWAWASCSPGTWSLFTASVPASRCSCAGWVVRRNSFGCIFWLDGITPWLLTAFIMWWGRRRALKLCTNKI